MADSVISYIEMCQREKTSLQQGMNFGLGGNHSVILMSVRPSAPYRDQLTDGGTTIIYEGHDHARGPNCPNPKLVDQPDRYPSGALTQNGRFLDAVTRFKARERSPERVRVYEKLRPGIWSYNGVFHLTDAWREHDGVRHVFKFKLAAVEGDEDFAIAPRADLPHRRVIPTSVKVEVWKRDGGRCAQCGATDELHFDHIVPWSKGGTSLTAENVQLLCARHNIQKRDDIL